MNKSILLASLLAVAALTACSKKEEPKVEVAPAPVVMPAPEAASAAASAVADAASDVADAAASAASK
ncbi:hypothetical protein [Roseateles sp.]|uniref:hypothetical protein n=1 Tax=Roseateles sp. TaxID=1971397 RepID=UPI0032672CB8